MKKIKTYIFAVSLIYPANAFLQASGADEAYPIFMSTPEEICKSIVFRDREGAIQTGTKDCAAISADLTQLLPQNIKTGVTINGVTGTSPGIYPYCSANGEVGCLATSTYKAADLTNLISGNIKAGVTIAGQTGTYPSAANPLVDSTATSDLTAATFNAQMTSSSSFEYWTSSGVRQTGSGDTQILSSNIANSVSIFGQSGSLTFPNAWDLRVGSSVVTPSGQVSGRLKVNCRNLANLSLYDAQLPVITVDVPESSSSTWDITNGTTVTDGDLLQLLISNAPSGFVTGNKYYVVDFNASNLRFKLSSTFNGPAITATTNGSSTAFFIKMGGGVVDYWDTIDDLNNSNAVLPSQMVTGWTSDNQCDGIEATDGDSNVWKDVTTTGDGVTASTCAASATNCSYQDKIAGLSWSKQVSTTPSWASEVT